MLASDLGRLRDTEGGFAWCALGECVAALSTSDVGGTVLLGEEEEGSMVDWVRVG